MAKTNRSRSKFYKLSTEENELLKIEMEKRNCRGHMDFILNLLDEIEEYQSQIKQAKYEEVDSNLSILENKINKQANDIRIIKLALEAQLGTNEFKKIIAKMYSGYND